MQRIILKHIDREAGKRAIRRRIVDQSRSASDDDLGAPFQLGQRIPQTLAVCRTKRSREFIDTVENEQSPLGVKKPLPNSIIYRDVLDERTNDTSNKLL